MQRDREFPRYAVAAAVTVRHGTIASEGKTSNVSRGGVCALIKHAVPVGATIAVEMKLVFDGGNTSDSLTLPARVAWSTPLDDAHQIGIAFRGLGAEQVKLLDLFLQYLAEGDRRSRPESDPDDLFRG